jgi:hypothetical protein
MPDRLIRGGGFIGCTDMHILCLLRPFLKFFREFFADTRVGRGLLQLISFEMKGGGREWLLLRGPRRILLPGCSNPYECR